MSTHHTSRGTTRRYSDAFKQQVVESIEKDGYTHTEAAQRYGCARSSIHRWVKEFGKAHLLNKVVRIQTMEEPDQFKQLQDENRRLKQALADAYMDRQLTEAQLALACQRLGVEVAAFKKKHAAPRST